MSDFRVEVEGLERVMGKVTLELLAKPLRKFFERATITVQNRARQNAPVDTGRLRSSIGTQVDSGELPTWGEVGTNVFYAPMMEYGTGLFAEGPGAKGDRHWPPAGALEVWASRHGFDSGFTVAQIIGRRGGLRPRRYLRNALKDSVNDIRAHVQRMANEIAEQWGK